MTEGESTKKTKSAAKAAPKNSKKNTAETVLIAPTAPAPAKAPKKAAPVSAEPKAPKAKAAAKPKATAKEVSAALTTIVAKADVGFGNVLFIRGTGPGMSWEKGVAMTNSGPDEWVWSSSKVTKPFEAKVLINDSIWSLDPDSTVAPGSKVLIDPSF
ncbi:MAG: hypothetical protein JW942_03520 [Opitutales bacterium]|nr:hypothetical protein [Opitutales bacterium]